MADALSDLIRLEVKLAEETRRLQKKILEAPEDSDPPSGHYGHYNCKLPSFLLAHLYQLKHPANPLQGSAWCAELAIALVDRWVSDWHFARKEGHRTSTGEWPIAATAQVMNFLGGEVDERRKSRWAEFVENYCLYALERPFGFTAPNHEIWRALGLYLAGKKLGHPDWAETGLFFCRQQIEYQTAEGFWEEGRHHGPSMRYNNVSLAGLALLHRLSGDRVIGEAAVRLATFMSTYTFPDATTIGAFDGRQSTSLAYYAPVVPGFELVPAGRTLNARGLELWRECGRLEDIRLFSNSRWYGFFSSMFYGAACYYYSELVPPVEREAALADSKNLPVDREGTLESHSAAFDALVRREGPWTLALSSQNSDIPKDAPSPYRLERQSRIELWHARGRLVFGGGHNRKDWTIPYANVVLDTGFGGVTQFGEVAPEGHDERRRYYLPRLARTRMAESRPELVLVFAHGTVNFRFDLQAESTCHVDAAWEVRRVQRICLQLPVIVWRGAKLLLDGKEQSGAKQGTFPLEKVLRVTGGTFDSRLSLRIPDGVPCRVHYPLETLRDYGGISAEDEELYSPFQMALVSCQWTNPAQSGQARFTLQVEKKY